MKELSMLVGCLSRDRVIAMTGLSGGCRQLFRWNVGWNWGWNFWCELSEPWDRRDLSGSFDFAQDDRI